jgi:hypothetical protein
MGIPDIWQLASSFGFGGIMLAYVVWKETNDRKDRNRRDDEHAVFRRERLEADKDEIESRLKLASALSALATIITGRAHV